MLRRGVEREELEPQPSLDQIEFLIDQVQRAGVRVKLDVEGQRPPLPAGLDLCAYRIVQEGLTNALKHAGPGARRGCASLSPDALDVQVRDDGRGVSPAAPGGTGHGLIGMRGHVALYGGQLTAGPGDGGGFQINARLPLA